MKKILALLLLILIGLAFLFTNNKKTLAQSSCTAWTGPITIASTGLGGSGSIRSQSSFVLGNKLIMGVWRGDTEATETGWSREFNINNGVVDYNSGTWSGPITLDSYPGSGLLVAQDSYVLGNQVLISYWRGSQGFYRIFNINGTTVDWNSGSWSSSGTLADLPGSGSSMQSQGSFIYDNNKKLMVGYWRSNEGYYRIFNINNGVVDYSSGAWNTTPLSANDLPGSGSMQDQDSFVLGNALTQSIWRGDQGWVRTVPIVSGEPQWNCPTPTSSVPPTVSLPPASCLCSSDECTGACQFDQHIDVTTGNPPASLWGYASRKKCTLSSSMQSSAPTVDQKNSYCRVRLWTKGDADGSGTVDNTDYFYYVAAANGGKIPPNVNPNFNGDADVGVKDRNIIMKTLRPN